jgi:hypothetical protein
MSRAPDPARRRIVLPTFAVLFAATVAAFVHLLFAVQDFEADAERSARLTALRSAETQVLRAASKRFVVRIVDPDGRPVRDAHVSLRNAVFRSVAEAPATDETGTCAFARDVVAGVVPPTFEVRAAGYRPRVDRLAPGELTATRRPRVISIDPSTSVSITVLGPRGRDASQVRVYAVAEGTPGVPEVAEVAGPLGKCRFTGLAPGRWRFEARDAEIENESPCGAEIRDGSCLELRLHTRVRSAFVGQLVDERGRALAGADVRWKLDRDPVRGGGASPDGATTDADGWFRLPIVGISVSTTLEVCTSTGRRAEVPDVWLRTSARSWTVPGLVPADPAKAPAISGRVVDQDGRGRVASVTVVADAGIAGPAGPADEGPAVATITTRADGAFDVEDLPPGAYWLVARLRGHDGMIGSRSPSARLRLPSIPRSGVELRLPAGSGIAGTVRDADGRPVAGLMLCAHRSPSDGEPADAAAAGAILATAMSDRRGEFVFEGLAPGRYAIEATSAGPGGGFPLLDGGDQVAAGNDGVALRVRASCTLRGVVRSAAGRAVRDVRVCAVARGRDELVRDATTAPDGGFELSGLRPDASYVVSVAFDDGSASDPVEVWTPRRDALALVVDTGREVSGTVRLAGGAPASRRRFLLRNRGLGTAKLFETDSDGGFALARVADAEFDVEPFVAGTAAAPSLGRVRPGAPVVLVLASASEGTNELKGR